jgi:hypothetical protein
MASLNKLRPLLAALCLAVSASAEAVDDHNGNLWFIYSGDHPLGEGPWGVHLEAQIRREDMGDEWQQLLLRPGVNYQVNPDLSLSAGWAYVRTYPYGDFPVAAEFPEHRAWEQAQHRFEFLGLEWNQRLRLEQRWLGEMARDAGGEFEVANWRYENRFRYLLRTTLPIADGGRTYLALWDEVFLNFGKNVLGNEFDQNRAFIGIGRKLDDFTRIEVGFLEQSLQRRGGKIWEHNHTLAFWVTSKWPFER